MKKKIALIFFATVLVSPLTLTLFAAPPLAIEKADDKSKNKSKKDKTPEPRTILTDFLAGTPYSRDWAKTIPSPFKNLIIVEKNRIKEELKKLEEIKAQEEARLAALDPNNPNKTPTPLPVGQKEKEFVLVQDAIESMKIVIQLAEIKKYDLAETKLEVMDNILSKNNVERYRDEIAKKKVEIIAEHKDWDEINKVINSLTVDAMFVAEGKKKVALINDIAVEEGDDLNDLLNLSKDAPIILTFVSGNSLKIKFKKFTLQKELIDNDL